VRVPPSASTPLVPSSPPLSLSPSPAHPRLLATAAPLCSLLCALLAVLAAASRRTQSTAQLRTNKGRRRGSRTATTRNASMCAYDRNARLLCECTVVVSAKAFLGLRARACVAAAVPFALQTSSNRRLLQVQTADSKQAWIGAAGRTFRMRVEMTRGTVLVAGGKAQWSSSCSGGTPPATEIHPAPPTKEGKRRSDV
jgi:hypothetical protein